MNIDVLGENDFTQITDRTEDGKMATTFRCGVDWGTGISDRSYLKCFTEGDKLGICNEITGYILGKQAGLPVPEKCAFIALPQYIKDRVKAFKNEECYEFGFVVSESPGATPNTLLKLVNLPDSAIVQIFMQVIEKWPLTAKLIAFDEWLANCDRNLGNFLIEPSGNVQIIDHSNLPVDLNWIPADLVPTRVYENKLVDIFSLLSGNGIHSLPDNAFIIKEAGDHDSILQQSVQELKDWWDYLLESDYEKSLSEFISIRAKKLRSIPYSDKSGMRMTA